MQLSNIAAWIMYCHDTHLFPVHDAFQFTYNTTCFKRRFKGRYNSIYLMINVVYMKFITVHKNHVNRMINYYTIW